MIGAALAALALVGCQQAVEEQPAAGSFGKADRIDCSAGRCPKPLCAQGQHLAYQGSCCPTCVGAEDRCATVLCAAIACPEGEMRIHPAGQCCGRCVPTPPVQECATDLDCPQYSCIRCPCPYSECRGTQCVTLTPSESTCGAP